MEGTELVQGEIGRSAVIVIDMIHDYVDPSSRHVVPAAAGVVPSIERLLAGARRRGVPVFHLVNRFSPDDVYLRGTRLRLHALAGTPGEEIVAPLRPAPGEAVIHKTRMNCFYRTDLQDRLDAASVDTVVIAGVATQGCVLVTALEAATRDYQTRILEDCAAAYPIEFHEQALALWRYSALYPLLQVLTLDEWLARVDLSRPLTPAPVGGEGGRR